MEPVVFEAAAVTVYTESKKEKAQGREDGIAVCVRVIRCH